MSSSLKLIGILYGSTPIISWFWVVLVAMMLWKLLFLIHAHRHHKLEKWIHIFSFVIGKCNSTQLNVQGGITADINPSVVYCTTIFI